MAFADILVLLILIFDFGISIWDAYASGYNIGMLRKQQNTSGFTVAAAWSGVGLAFAGITYVLLVVLSYVGAYLGYIDPATATAVLGFDSLVFGLMIIGFGLMITIQSIIIAAKTKNIWSIVIAAINTIFEVLNIIVYVETFQQSVQMVKGIAGNRKDEQNFAILVILAIVIGYFITQAAYNRGIKKAEDTNIQSIGSQQGKKGLDLKSKH